MYLRGEGPVSPTPRPKKKAAHPEDGISPAPPRSPRTPRSRTACRRRWTPPTPKGVCRRCSLTRSARSLNTPPATTSAAAAPRAPAPKRRSAPSSPPCPHPDPTSNSHPNLHPHPHPNGHRLPTQTRTATQIPIPVRTPPSTANATPTPPPRRPPLRTPSHHILARIAELRPVLPRLSRATPCSKTPHTTSSTHTGTRARALLAVRPHARLRLRGGAAFFPHEYPAPPHKLEDYKGYRDSSWVSTSSTWTWKLGLGGYKALDAYAYEQSEAQAIAIDLWIRAKLELGDAGLAAGAEAQMQTAFPGAVQLAGGGEQAFAGDAQFEQAPAWGAVQIFDVDVDARGLTADGAHPHSAGAGAFHRPRPGAQPSSSSASSEVSMPGPGSGGWGRGAGGLLLDVTPNPTPRTRSRRIARRGTGVLFAPPLPSEQMLSRLVALPRRR
ncbi:hypothetical protein B0H14DRAFT_3556911 [Mycena olivaceomarginata]|nr:hypothetical protein B0H14DRAFT_3556911 [Mycena olivaceomarginata]